MALIEDARRLGGERVQQGFGSLYVDLILRGRSGVVVTLVQGDDALIWRWGHGSPGMVTVARLIVREAVNRGNVRRIYMDATGIGFVLFSELHRRLRDLDIELHELARRYQVPEPLPPES